MGHPISRLIVAFWLFGIESVVCAEESIEGSLALNKFSFESSGTGKTGPVTVSGTQTTKGIATLQIAAFGRTFVLAPAQLQKLRDLAVNSMRLSCWTEYPEYGDRRI